MEWLKKNPVPLIAGLLLILLGGLLLAVNVAGLAISWLYLLQFLIPVLFILLGVSRLVRHYIWSEEDLRYRPGKAGLLSGLFWVGLGIVLLLDVLDVVESLSFVGRYWPALLILYGIGRVVDFYRLSSPLPVRTAEIFGLVFIITFGLVSHRISQAHLPLLITDIPILDSLGIFTDSDGRRFRFKADQSLPAAEIQSLEISNLYGGVRIEAGAGEMVDIQLDKQVLSDSEETARELADRLEIRSSSENGVLRIATNREELGERGNRLLTSFIVRVPERLQVRVLNSYGNVSMIGIKAPCRIESSYGEVEVESISGDLHILNRYKPVVVKDVQGAVTVDNRRAAIRVEQVRGPVVVSTEHDSVTVRNIVGHVTVRNQFGRIDLEQVTEGASIDGAGCRINLSKIDKAVDVVKHSHASLRASELADTITVETAYSDVRLERVQGAVTISASHARISAERLTAGLTIQARGSKVDVADVEGPLKIVSSMQDVNIRRFHGFAEIQNEFAATVLSLDDPLAGPVKVSNRNGPISLSLPSAAKFRLNVQNRGGEIKSDFGPEPGQGADNLRFLEVDQNGGPEIILQTSFAPIQIKKRG